MTIHFDLPRFVDLDRPIKGKLIRIGNETKNGQHRHNEKFETYQSISEGKTLDEVNAKDGFILDGCRIYIIEKEMLSGIPLCSTI